MAAWTWVVGGPAPSGVEQRELTAAYGRRITWRLDAPCDAQFSIDGRHDEAAEIVSLATDLHVYRDGTKVFRGRCRAEVDTITPDEHTVQFSAIDYRGMLRHRVVGPNGRTFTSVDQGQIAWMLIDESQQQPGGDWGITDGIGSTSGTARDRTYQAGAVILDQITLLGQVDGGFEWEVDADLALNRWYPWRGANNGITLDFGGLVTGLRRTLDPGDFANAVLVTGAEHLAPVVEDSPDIGSDQRGRWEFSAGYPTIEEQATLDARAVWLLDQASMLRPEWSVTLNQERWDGPSHVWLGDSVLLVVRSGRLDVAELHRVVEVQIVLDGDGRETVTMGLVAGGVPESGS